MAADGSPASKVLKIAIEGNIGAGKSTLLRLLMGRLNFVVVPEPVSKWTAVEDTDGEDPGRLVTASQEDGANLLGRFYNDPPRWSFTFQSFAFLSRVKAQMRPFHEHDEIFGAWTRRQFASLKGEEEAKEVEGAGSKRSRSSEGKEDEKVGGTPPKVVRLTEESKEEDGIKKELEGEDAIPELKGDEILFFERSVLSDRYCFASNCRATGLLDEAEWRVYKLWWELMTDSFKELTLDGIIYLRTSPHTCEERMNKRGREEESAVELGYLQQLHLRHEEWLVAQQGGASAERTRVPVLVIDCDVDFEHHEDRQKEIFDRVDNFVKALRDTSALLPRIDGEIDVPKALKDLDNAKINATAPPKEKPPAKAAPSDPTSNTKQSKLDAFVTKK